MKFIPYSTTEFQGTGILKFYATWCVPCRTLSTLLHSSDFTEYHQTVYEVDVDLEPELASLYRIMSVPTLVYMRDNKEYARMSGHGTSAQIRNFIQKGLVQNDK